MRQARRTKSAAGAGFTIPANTPHNFRLAYENAAPKTGHADRQWIAHVALLLSDLVNRGFRRGPARLQFLRKRPGVRELPKPIAATRSWSGFAHNLRKPCRVIREVKDKTKKKSR